MSRNFTADQILTDRLVSNDTKAFEELYRRYWYSLYFVGLRRLQCREQSRQLVQTVFADLWQQRHSFNASTHLAQHLYDQGQRELARRSEQQPITVYSEPTEELESAESLQQPGADLLETVVTPATKVIRVVHSTPTKLNTYLSFKEKDQLEEEILETIQALTAYPLLFPKKEIYWWQRIAAMF